MAVTAWTPMSAFVESDDFPFMLKFRANKGGYALEITDMACLWEETVSKQNLIRRATASNCPIDPSQDDEQLETLLRHLTKGLLGEPAAETECRVEKGHKYLQVDIVCKLPGGLHPLKWSFTAEQKDAVAFRNQVLLPMIERVNAKEHAVNELVRLLSEKDAAITNVLDKVESSGIDLATLFPTANAGRIARKAEKKTQLRNTVKGLQMFDASSFLEQQQDATCTGKLTAESASIALGGRTRIDGASSGGQMHVETDSPTKTTRLGEKQESVKVEPASDNRGGTDPPVVQSRPKPLHQPEEDDTTEDEDDLDEQPKLKTSAPKALDKHTSSDADIPASDEVDTPPRTVDATHTVRNNHTEAKKLGKIGGHKPKRSSPDKEADGITSVGNETESTSSEQLDDNAVPVRTKPKLGAIGGKKKAGAATNDRRKADLVVDGTSDTRQSEAKSPQKHTTSSATNTRELVTEDSSNGNQNHSTNPKQAADQKREALKRNLEAQSKSQSKKKRKF